MGLDLNTTTVTASAGLDVTFSGSLAQEIDAVGNNLRYLPGQPMFRAMSNMATGWYNYGTNTWIAPNMNTANPNVGSCFNTSNFRFTAPVDGVYLFGGSTYSTGPAVSWYVHGMFHVNGGAQIRRPGVGAWYRLWMYGAGAGGIWDTNCVEIMKLFAGDYVNYMTYPNVATNQLYAAYSRFEGYLLG